ncbi:MAG: xanthine dehydrogenase family protein subunit M [Acidimicrobiia bacterium]|nr:xanthine dehydrogenase family protein subunit M [Acidimicrobiia bacterium]
MHPAPFDYQRPVTLDEAFSLLGAEGARPLAGGHSLLPAMKLRVSNPATLVDISRIPGLDAIEQNGGGLTIGALATHEVVAASTVVATHCRILAETAAHIGDAQVRARGTMGGSIAHADPAADYPTTLLALGATVNTASVAGTRQVAIGDFFVDIFTTALELGELITSVTIPSLPAGTGGVYLKHRHPASSYAVVGIAAIVMMEGGSITGARLAVGGVAGKPVAVDVSALTGQAPSPEVFASAAGAVAGALGNPIGDLYASGEYRVHLAGVLARRALAAAAERTAG